MISQQFLDSLWVDDDPAASEALLRSAMAGTALTETERSELATQLARAIGLQGKFDEAAAMLIELPASDDAAVGIRILLESARVMSSAGNADVAIALFRQAEAIAGASEERFLRVDALHELANLDPAVDAPWTASAVALAADAPDARTRRWLITLHSDHGWRQLTAGQAAEALSSFAEAARVADEIGTPDEVTWTHAAHADHAAALAAITAVS